MKLNKLGAFIAVMVIVLGGALMANALGLFAVESEKEAALIKTGDFAGIADPNDIRGSYSFADIEKNFGVSPELLAKAFGIEGTAEEIAAYQCKGLEEKYVDAPEEIGTSSVRLFVAFLLGVPVELGSFLPESAVEVILENNSQIAPERQQYLKEHTIIFEDAVSLESEPSIEQAALTNQAEVEVIVGQPKETTVAATAPVKATTTAVTKEKEPAVSPSVSKEVQTVEASLPEPVQTPPTKAEVVEQAVIQEEVPVDPTPVIAATEEHVSNKEVGTVKGSTTIYDMMSWGVKREEIGPAVDIELPSDNGAKLKDLITEAGKSFDELKIILQKLVDEAK